MPGQILNILMYKFLKIFSLIIKYNHFINISYLRTLDFKQVPDYDIII
jgi:hypothetical protein